MTAAEITREVRRSEPGFLLDVLAGLAQDLGLNHLAEWLMLRWCLGEDAPPYEPEGS